MAGDVVCEIRMPHVAGDGVYEITMTYVAGDGVYELRKSCVTGDVVCVITMSHMTEDGVCELSLISATQPVMSKIIGSSHFSTEQLGRELCICGAAGENLCRKREAGEQLRPSDHLRWHPVITAPIGHNSAA